MGRVCWLGGGLYTPNSQLYLGSKLVNTVPSDRDQSE